jgi:hypothetical protein
MEAIAEELDNRTNCECATHGDACSGCLAALQWLRLYWKAMKGRR